MLIVSLIINFIKLVRNTADKKEKNSSAFLSITIGVVSTLLIIIGLFISNNNKELEKVLNKEGYTKKESVFYKKIQKIIRKK